MSRHAIVVGAGIGGLTAAVALRRRGWDVTILEHARALEPVGAGLGLGPNALHALDAIGLGDEVRRFSAIQGHGGLRRPGGGWLVRTDLGGLADDVARMVHQWIIEPRRRRRFLARLELAFEATRRPELRGAYDEMGRGFRTEAARLLAAAGSAHPERDAWTLIAWVEGTAFYALAGAGGAAVPSLAELRAQVAGLLASLCGDDAGAA